MKAKVLLHSSTTQCELTKLNFSKTFLDHLPQAEVVSQNLADEETEYLSQEVLGQT